MVTFIVAVSSIGASGPAPLSPDSAMAAVQQFVYGFNRGGNTKRALAACAPQTSIIDEFPPHHWKTCTAWAAAYAASAKQAGDTDRLVSLQDFTENIDSSKSEPVAYVVAHANLRYKEGGKIFAEIGSVWTIVLDKTASGWRITAWTWSNVIGAVECVRSENGPCPHLQPLRPLKQPAP
jgi:hypothetical protein